MSNDLLTIDESNVAHSSFVTYSYETDCFSDARLAFYFQVVQEAAGMHAAQRGCSIPAMHEEGKTWVITRSQMEVERYTRWPEVLNVETWAQEPIRLHLPRVVRAFDQAGNLVFTTRTQWAILDLANGRPCRPLDMATRIGLPPKEDTVHHLEMLLAKRPSLAEDERVLLTSSRPVISYLDTDRNQHVNNISYMNWALDSLPSAFRNRLKVCAADFSYLRQTFLGDELLVSTFGRNNDVLLEESAELDHIIERRESDGSRTLVWEGSTKWKKREELR
ncbi:acyl-[acyl-carrier-protein] thioesterase [Sphaerochaeta sp.]|uniref:acyl-[acyl-carrier-protein] thioesterase n=1 Tax=Sphaerochaeta sp. TaxID=1972642 RepID=UPI003D14F63D